MNQRDRQPGLFYFHPWEVDPGQPRVAGAPLKSRFRHYLNLGSMHSRLERLLGDFALGRPWMTSLAFDLPAVRADVAAGVEIRRLAETDRDAWNAFVRAHPEGTFFHLAEWQDVLRRAFGHGTHYLLAERGGVVCGVLPHAEVKSLLFGHALVSTPFCVYGGIVATDAATHAALEAAACGWSRRTPS